METPRPRGRSCFLALLALRISTIHVAALVPANKITPGTRKLTGFRNGVDLHAADGSAAARSAIDEPVSLSAAADPLANSLSVVGAASLVAGNMVGGGILAIPTVSAAAGFVPSSALLFALWTANVGTGLLLGEVAAAAIRDGEDDVSLRTLSRNALGESGSSLTSALFAGTNVLLMGAYIALGGDTLFGHSDDFVAPRVAYAALTAALVAFPAVMEPANNALVVVMTGALVALLAVAAPSVDVGHLLQSAPPEELGGALASAAPVLVSSLVFQNVVPVIAKGFDGDSAKIREAVVLGSAAPLFAYVAFTASVLGRGGGGAAAGELIDAARGLPEDLRPAAAAALSVFSVAAVTTSFVGAAVSQSEEVRGYRKDDDALNAAWTFAPPLLLALSGRDVFLPLLSMTGGIANPFLFGLLPCLLAWRHRYDGDAEPEEILPGGRVGVSALGSGAGFLVLNAGLADAAHAVSETVAHIHL